MPWDVRSPHLKEILSRFLDVVIPQVRSKPALLDYDLINEAWYRPFAHLDNATVTNFMKAHPSVKREDVPEQYTTEQVTDFMKWYAGEVRKRDARHPIYAKVLTSQEVLCVDREALGDILTANGMDSYPEYPDPTGVLAADFAWTFCALISTGLSHPASRYWMASTIPVRARTICRMRTFAPRCGRRRFMGRTRPRSGCMAVWMRLAAIGTQMA